MILVWMIILPLAGGTLSWLAGRRSALLARSTALISLISVGVLLGRLWQATQTDAGRQSGAWFAEFSRAWVPQFGIGLHLAVDGLSFVFLALTVILGIAAVICSWSEISERTGFFHLNLLWTLAGIIGVFLALDLFLFSFFWELMLIPMYILISIWGHENRGYASLKFFLFTQAGGLLMLVAIVALYLLHGRQTGTYTFDLTLLLGASLRPSTAFWIMLGFLAAFGVKVPVVALHTWLPDAHTEAPTAGSVLLAGLLLKTGAYGILRFVIPLFPDAASAVAPAIMFFGAAGILYGAVLAFAQSDLKRLVAYTSVSHMGFVLLGIFAGTQAARAGAVLQMVAHGFSTAALFILAGMLQERVHTRDLGRMGGFAAHAPRMAALGMLFALASLGLPGTANFAAEFLVLIGAYRTSVPLTVLAAAGLVFAAVYSLRLAQGIFHGAPSASPALADLSARETVLLAVLAAATIGLGVHPQPVLRTAGPALTGVVRSALHEPSAARLPIIDSRTVPSTQEATADEHP